MSKKAKRILRKLDYLPRWAWYALSFFVLPPPIGLFAVYLIFRALEHAAEEEDEEERGYDWDVNFDRDGVHVRRRGGHETYEDEDCVVTDERDVESAWERTEESARRAPQERETPVEPIAEDAGVADVVRQGRDALARMRRADEIIADAELSAQIVSIEESCEQILSILEQRPQVLPQLRTFLRYYLPTTLKLLDARAKLEHGANTPRAWQVRTRVSEAIGEIDKAFHKQVEALDEYRFIDLESEMDVLRDMLRADGLTDDAPQDDPFADVLDKRAAEKKKKRGGDPGTPMATH